MISDCIKYLKYLILIMPNERSFMDVLKYIHPSCCTDLGALSGHSGDGLSKKTIERMDLKRGFWE